MPWNWEAITAGAISGGLLSSTLTIFVAPHINWGVEKKRLLRSDRKEKLLLWQSAIGANKVNPILTRDIYPQIKPYLQKDTIEAIEAYTMEDWNSGNHEKFGKSKTLVLRDFARLQKEWELV